MIPQKMLFMRRYPEVLREQMTFENTLFFHGNFPEMIAEILKFRLMPHSVLKKGPLLMRFKPISLCTKVSG